VDYPTDGNNNKAFSVSKRPEKGRVPLKTSRFFLNAFVVGEVVSRPFWGVVVLGSADV
jgi:hypothetical protein